MQMQLFRREEKQYLDSCCLVSLLPYWLHLSFLFALQGGAEDFEKKNLTRNRTSWVLLF